MSGRRFVCTDCSRYGFCGKFLDNFFKTVGFWESKVSVERDFLVCRVNVECWIWDVMSQKDSFLSSELIQKYLNTPDFI